MQTAREFFETLESRVDSEKAQGINNSYLFDIEGAGRWLVAVEDGTVKVTEDGGDADCTISASEDNFQKIVNGEQNPTSAYMMRKNKIKGDMTPPMKLQKLF